MHNSFHSRSATGFTLVEIAVVIALIMAISLAGMGIGGYYTNYQKGVTVGTDLKITRQAQLAYLSDNPTNSYSDCNWANLSPYFINNQPPTNNLPTLNGQTVTLIPTNFPPVAETNGTIISTNTDGIWNSGP